MRKHASTRRDFLLTAGAVSTAVSAVVSAAAAQAQQAVHQQHPSLTLAQKEQQAFQVLALKMFVEVDSDDTNGAIAVVRIFVPPGQGAAPHVHSREDEIHTVVRGHYRFRHGDVEVDAPAGTTVYMPRGIPHTFKNISDEPGEHLAIAIPGGLEKMFRELSAAKVRMPQDAAKRDEIFAKYGLKSLPPASLPLSTDRG